VHDAHSIWFEILGEHGFVGFGMFLLLGIFVLLSSRRIMKQTKKVPGLEWLFHLASMMQVSIIGYAAAGTFLGLAYFDLLYCLVAVVVIAKKLTRDELAKRDSEAENEVAPRKLKKPRMAYG
jgi:O-antigen ligase